MKKFNRNIHRSMGEMPPQIRAMAPDTDIAHATSEFISFMTTLATEFHRQLADGLDKDKIKLIAPGQLFGHDVKLDYVASGSVGSVYKIQIGEHAFAFKINRNSSHGELTVMSLQKHARGLVNRMHIGHVFEYGGRKYSWVLSDFIENNRTDSFESAMEKMYFLYLTRGLTIKDAHPGNFKDGMLIDTPSLSVRNGMIDDIKNLTRIQLDMVKKLAYYIKTDDMPAFRAMVDRALKSNPSVIEYMFFAMKYARGATFRVGKTDDFAIRLHKFEGIINSAYKNFRPVALAPQHLRPGK